MPNDEDRLSEIMRGFQKLQLESEEQRRHFQNLEKLGQLGEDADNPQYQIKESRNDSVVPPRHA